MFVSDGEKTGRAKLAVLAIDDDAGDAEILRRHLARLHRYDVTLVHAASLAAAQGELNRPGTDVIFLDYQLGAETGQELLQAMRAAGDLRPVIILTGQGDQTIAAALMRSGADDYLVKGEIDTGTLARAIDNARAQHVRRKIEAHNRQLLEDLQVAKAMLETKNRRLAELYETAHEFVDHVSHEFRTPLTVIREFASLMREGLAGAVNDEQREYLEIVVNRVDDLSVLVDDMLDISKLESGLLGISRSDCRVEDILAHVRTTLERRAATAGARLEIRVAPGLPPVYCDAEKIGRVIINLVINALKFCGEHGHVRLDVSLKAASCEVWFAVRDNGRGIAPESLETLFQRFRQIGGQARNCLKGFGLGLSIVKELVHLNLGEIEVESQQGHGSTFSFSVPLSERRSLLARYVNMIEHLRNGSAWVTLVHVASDPDAPRELLEELHYFVQQHTRRTDLLFRAAAHRWVVVAAASQGDLGPTLERLQCEHAEVEKNRTGEPLPPVTVEYGGSWNVCEGGEAFIQRVLETEQSLETHHA